MIRPVLVLGLALALAGPASAATGYSFGREGGSIIPFTVSVSAGGAVHVTGPVKVGRTKLTATQLATIGKTASAAGFAKLPATTLCPHTLPDIAATFVTAGGRKVTVHGGCSARYTEVWNALVAAVKLAY